MVSLACTHAILYRILQMMQNLALEEGEIVNLKSASLPKGTYVKLQPHTTDFLDISNPKAVLETTLRNFSCLTVGDQITINYNNRQYFIDIVEAKPQPAISVIETDCEVDFAPPLDYVEPSRQPPPPPPVEEPAQGQLPHAFMSWARACPETSSHAEVAAYG